MPQCGRRNDDMMVIPTVNKPEREVYGKMPSALLMECGEMPSALHTLSVHACTWQIPMTSIDDLILRSSAQCHVN